MFPTEKRSAQGGLWRWVLRGGATAGHPERHCFAVSITPDGVNSPAVANEQWILVVDNSVNIDRTVLHIDERLAISPADSSETCGSIQECLEITLEHPAHRQSHGAGG